MAIFNTFWCPRFKKNIAFCNEEISPKEAIKKGIKLYPVPCKYGSEIKCTFKKK